MKTKIDTFLKRLDSNRTLYLLLATCFAMFAFVRFHVDQPITGDEPHYLLMSHSLVHDGDFNIKNNYQNGDYASFYPLPLSPYNQVAYEQLSTDSSKFYSIHGIGIPLLAAPAYLIGGANGVIIFMLLIATATIWLSWLWVLQITGKRRLATLAAGSFAITLSITGLAGYIYPDLVTAALALAALLIIEKYYLNPKLQFLFGWLIGLMVFAHFKTLALAGPLFLALAYRVWRSQKKLPWLAFLGSGILVVLFFVTLRIWYDVWNPSSIYNPTIDLGMSPLRTIPGILFDSTKGLLVYNPILILLFMGLVPWYKKSKESLILTLLIMLPSIGLLVTFNFWNGGYAPLARYPIGLVPAFLPALGFAFGVLKRRWQQIVVALLLLITLLLTVLSVITKMPYIDPDAYRTKSYIFTKIDNRTGINFERLFPSFSSLSTLDNKKDFIKVSAGCMLIATVFLYGASQSKSIESTRKKNKGT